MQSVALKMMPVSCLKIQSRSVMMGVKQSVNYELSQLYHLIFTPALYIEVKSAIQ